MPAHQAIPREKQVSYPPPPVGSQQNHPAPYPSGKGWGGPGSQCQTNKLTLAQWHGSGIGAGEKQKSGGDDSTSGAPRLHLDKGKPAIWKSSFANRASMKGGVYTKVPSSVEDCTLHTGTGADN